MIDDKTLYATMDALMAAPSEALRVDILRALARQAAEVERQACAMLAHYEMRCAADAGDPTGVARCIKVKHDITGRGGK